jgi:Flp pilus assembly pilin Flp
MRQMLSKMWNDDTGALIATEWVFFVTILVLGIITGLVALRQAVISETTELAQAIMSLNQSFSFSGQENCESSSGGSSAIDTANTVFNSSVAVGTNSVGFINQAPCD